MSERTPLEAVSTPDASGETSASSPRKFMRKIMTMAALVAVTLFGFSATPPAPAEAAAAVGNGGYWTPYGGWLGSYIVNGQRVYCIDVTVDTIGSSGDQGIYSEIKPVPGTQYVSGDSLKRLNYVVSRWGQTSDTNQAAAVSAYVYSVTSANNNGPHGHYIGSNAPAAVRDLFNKITADANKNFNAVSGNTNTNGELVFSVNSSDNYRGTVKVRTADTAARGTITLKNGVFTDTKKATRANVKNGDVFNVVGVPPEGKKDYEISGTAAMTRAGGTYYNANIRIYNDAPSLLGNAQRTIGVGTKGTTPGNFTIKGKDPGYRSAEFSPIVKTVVSTKFVQRGEKFSDKLTFGLAKNPDGTTNQWYKSPTGKKMPITAYGTLYGHSEKPFTESAIAPADMPIIESGIKVTTTLADGPDKEYVATTEAVAEVSGYYTWVWEIHAKDQDATTQKLLPKNYSFVDRFGQVAETSITPTVPKIETAVTKTIAGLDEFVTDEVTLSADDDVWLYKGANQVPAVLRGTAYYVADEPVQQPDVPEGAEVVGETTLAFTGPETLLSDPIRMPVKEGFVTWRWCLNKADQPAEFRDYLVEGCDDFGVPTETTKLEKPEVVTQAQASVPVYGDFNDVATVNGFVPESSELEFALYKRPVAGDPKRNVTTDAPAEGDESTESAAMGEGEEPVSNVWTEEEIAALGEEPYCGTDNLVLTTERVAVEPGENVDASYASPFVNVGEDGEFWWIESLVTVPPNSEEEVVVHTGKCGLPNETTFVELPYVASKAVTEVIEGEHIFDTAIVSGALVTDHEDVSYEVKFEAYSNPTGNTTEVDESLCTPETKLDISTAGIPVTGEGEYKSEEWQTAKAHLGQVLWVESLWVTRGEGEPVNLHRGGCGVVDEITTVNAPPPPPGIPGLPKLPNTGSAESNMLWMGGAALLLLVGGGAALVLARRRKATASAEADSE